jgi:hypothetical protein
MQLDGEVLPPRWSAIRSGFRASLFNRVLLHACAALTVGPGKEPRGVACVPSRHAFESYA